MSHHYPNYWCRFENSSSLSTSSSESSFVSSSTFLSLSFLSFLLPLTQKSFDSHFRVFLSSSNSVASLFRVASRIVIKKNCKKFLEVWLTYQNFQVFSKLQRFSSLVLRLCLSGRTNSSKNLFSNLEHLTSYQRNAGKFFFAREYKVR